VLVVVVVVLSLDGGGGDGGGGGSGGCYSDYIDVDYYDDGGEVITYITPFPFPTFSMVL
jgi:hypothetical protein